MIQSWMFLHASTHLPPAQNSSEGDQGGDDACARSKAITCAENIYLA